MNVLVLPNSVEERVSAVRDHPEERVRLAVGSYRSVDSSDRLRPYARAVADFMHWQNRRGVLNPTDSPTPGSPWWRAVNEDLLRDTEEAAVLVRTGRGADARPAVQRWVRFFTAPSPASWYLAHNGSVVEGYLAHQDLAAAESAAERFFMNVVLVRVLYAQALVSDGELALGRLSFLARLVGHPRLRSPGVFLSIANVLPGAYPITEQAAELVGLEHPLGRLLDFGVISGRTEALYASAAALLGEPRLLDLVDRGTPAYVWPSVHRHVWTDPPKVSRTPQLEAWVQRLTRPRRQMAAESV